MVGKRELRTTMKNSLNQISNHKSKTKKMNKKQRDEVVAEIAATAQKTSYLQLLSKLGSSPNITIAKKIGYFYKNDVPEGFGGYIEDIDEDYAKYIVESLIVYEKELKSHSEDEQKEIVQHYKQQLERGREIMKNDDKHWFMLFCNIWLLEKIGAIVSDDFNGVIFRSEQI